MKTTNQSLNFLFVTFAVAGIGHAAFVVDDFESYAVDSNISGQGGWTVTNGLTAGSEPVAIVDAIPGFTQSATIGELLPATAGTTTMNHAAAISAQWTSSFSIKAAYAESISGFRNDFTISVGTNEGNLLQILLSPSLTVGTYVVSYSGLIGSGTLGTLNEFDSTTFELGTYFDGVNVNYSFSNFGVPVNSGIVTGLDGSDIINGVSVSWDNLSGGGFGDNFITVDNVNLIPEPSSALLGMLGASFVFLRRRRA